ncbi:MAG: hypothetical protein IKQ92_04645 [Clostridia bacterium]|nr:hypothetical protein [Clostridia bacterium]
MKTAWKLLSALLTLALAVLLVITGACAAGIRSVRRTYTEEFVSEAARGARYSEVRIPDGFGGFETLPGFFNRVLKSAGVDLKDDRFEELMRELGADALVEDHLLELRSWLLDYGPEPRIDADAMAERVFERLDPLVAQVLGYFVDPVALIAAAFDRLLEPSQLGERLEALDPVRPLIEPGAFVFACAAALMLILLILVSRRLRLLPALTISAFALAGSGLLLRLSPALLASERAALLGRLRLPESTFDPVWQPLMKRFVSDGEALAVYALIAAAVLLALTLFLFFVKRAAKRRALQNEELTEELEFLSTDAADAEADAGAVDENGDPFPAAEGSDGETAPPPSEDIESLPAGGTEPLPAEDSESPSSEDAEPPLPDGSAPLPAGDGGSASRSADTSE